MSRTGLSQHCLFSPKGSSRCYTVVLAAATLTVMPSPARLPMQFDAVGLSPVEPLPRHRRGFRVWSRRFTISLSLEASVNGALFCTVTRMAAITLLYHKLLNAGPPMRRLWRCYRVFMPPSGHFMAAAAPSCVGLFPDHHARSVSAPQVQGCCSTLHVELSPRHGTYVLHHCSAA